MSEPQIDFLESEQFSEIGARTSAVVNHDVWEYIRERMTITMANQAWLIGDYLEKVAPWQTPT